MQELTLEMYTKEQWVGILHFQKVRTDLTLEFFGPVQMSLHDDLS